MHAEPRATAALSTAGRAGEAVVWTIRLDRPPAQVAELERRLPADERARAARFAFARDRRRFVVCRTALRDVLGEAVGLDPAAVAFEYGPHGKPRLADGRAGVEFNVAHSGELALAAVSRGAPVGVDLEHVRPLSDLEGLARTAFAPAEQAELFALPSPERLQAFFACWTRKEAFVKAVGEGVAFGLDRFEVSLAPGDPPRLRRVEGDATAPARWSIAALVPAPGYVGALAVETPAPALHTRRWPEDART